MENPHNTEESNASTPDTPSTNPLLELLEETSEPEDLQLSENQRSSAYFREQERILSSLRHRRNTHRQNATQSRHQSHQSNRSRMSEQSSSSLSSSSSNRRDDDREEYETSRGSDGVGYFYGNSSDKITADIHVSSFETAMRVKKVALDSRGAVDRFTLSLKGSAQTWFYSEIKAKYEPEYNRIRLAALDVPISPESKRAVDNNPLQNFEVLKQLFISYFMDPTDQATIMTDIQNARLSNFSTVDEYTDYMAYQYRRFGKLDNSTQAMMYIRNCDVEGFRSYLTEKNPQTLKEAHNLAKLKENALKSEELYVPYNTLASVPVNPLGRPGPARASRNQVTVVNSVSPSGTQRPTLSDVIGLQLTTLFKDLSTSMAKSQEESFEKLGKSLVEAISKGFKEASRSSFRQNGQQRPNQFNQQRSPYQGGLNGQKPFIKNGNSPNKPFTLGQSNYNSANRKPGGNGTGTFIVSEEENSQRDDEYEEDNVHVNHVPFDNQDQEYYDEGEDEKYNQSNIVSTVWPPEISPGPLSSVNAATPSSPSNKTCPKPKNRVLPLFFKASLVVEGRSTEKPIRVIVDTGSGITLVSLNLLTQLDKEMGSPVTPLIRQLPASEMPTLTGAALGSSLNVMGSITLSLKTGTVMLQPMVFIVVANLTSDVIIGGDELSNGKLFGNIHVASKKLSYVGNGKREIIHLELQDNMPHTGASSIIKSHTKNVAAFNNGIQPQNAGYLSAVKEIKILPRSTIQLTAPSSLKIPDRQSLEKRLGDRIHSASFVISPSSGLRKSPVVFQDLVCDADSSVIGGQKEVKIRLINSGHQTVLIPQGSTIAHVEVFWSEGVIPVQTIMKQIERHERKMDEERTKKGDTLSRCQ